MPVTVTGFALFSPAGLDWRHALARVTERDGGSVRSLPPLPETVDFDAAALLGKKGLRVLDRASCLLAATIRSAAHEAGLGDALAGAETALVAGTCYAFAESYATFVDDAAEHGPTLANPTFFARAIASAAPSLAALRLGITGAVVPVCGGLCAGGTALAVAHQLVAAGRFPRAVAASVATVEPRVAELTRRSCPGRRPIELAAAMIVEPLDTSSPDAEPSRIRLEESRIMELSAPQVLPEPSSVPATAVSTWIVFGDEPIGRPALAPAARLLRPEWDLGTGVGVAGLAEAVLAAGLLRSAAGGQPEAGAIAASTVDPWDDKQCLFVFRR